MEFFNVTGEAGRLPKALEHISQGRRRLGGDRAADRRRVSDKLMMTMSPSPQQWKNSLAEVNEDVAYRKSLLQKHGDGGGSSAPFRVRAGR